jgi:hypothetical protein
MYTLRLHVSPRAKNDRGIIAQIENAGAGINP